MEQLKKISDSVYGLTSLHYILSNDQVPLELAANEENTIDVKAGVSFFYMLIYPSAIQIM